MIDLWYFNTKGIDEDRLNILLGMMPHHIIREIIRYKNHEDRRLKLFGKLIVRKYYNDSGLEFHWNDWAMTSMGKPYIKDKKKFNISHSGEYIVVAFSDKKIGVDIEAIANFDVTSLTTYFHSEEMKCIKESPDPKETFFILWTRKEAYLKAIGNGIIDGIHQENCIPDKIKSEETWFLHSIPLIPGYQVALCTQIAECNIFSTELSIHDFKN